MVRISPIPWILQSSVAAMQIVSGFKDPEKHTYCLLNPWFDWHRCGSRLLEAMLKGPLHRSFRFWKDYVQSIGPLVHALSKLW